MLDFLSHGFVQRALIAGSFIAVLCSTLGVFLVLRRLSLIGDGLAHVTFGSVAVGLLLRVYPVWVAAPLVMLSSLGIMKLTDKARMYGDAAIAIVSSLGISGGILLASVAGGFNVDRSILAEPANNGLCRPCLVCRKDWKAGASMPTILTG